MVAQGEAPAEGQAKPWDQAQQQTEPRRGDRTEEASVAPTGLVVFSRRYPGFARIRSLHPGLPSVAPPGLKTPQCRFPSQTNSTRLARAIVVPVRDAHLLRPQSGSAATGRPVPSRRSIALSGRKANAQP